MQTNVSRFGHERKGRPLWLIADSTLSNSNMVSMSHRSDIVQKLLCLVTRLPQSWTGQVSSFCLFTFPVVLNCLLLRDKTQFYCSTRNRILLLQLPCLLLQHSILFLYDAKPAVPHSGTRLVTETGIYVVHNKWIVKKKTSDQSQDEKVLVKSVIYRKLWASPPS